MKMKKKSRNQIIRKKTDLLEKRKIWIDGRSIPFKNAQVSILSHSFARGSAIFEVMSAYHPEKGVAIFRLSEHLDRLMHSADALMMKIPLSRAQIKQAIFQTLKANKVDHGLVKVIAFYPGFGLEVIPTDPKVSVAVAAFQFERDFKLSKFGEDRFATAGISKWRKMDPATVPVYAKASGNYLNPMLAKLEIRSRGFKTPILLDTQGYVAEGATESIFIVKNNRIYTPSLDNILPSITRLSILEICHHLGIPVQEKKLKPQDLFTCDEAFFSSTTCKVWPISKIEKHQLPAPGPLSQRLKDYFDQILAGKIKKFQSWLNFP